MNGARYGFECKIESPVHHLDTWELLRVFLKKFVIALKKEVGNPKKKSRPSKSFGGWEFWDICFHLHWKTTRFPGSKESISSGTPTKLLWRLSNKHFRGGSDHVYPELFSLQFLKGDKKKIHNSFSIKGVWFLLYAMNDTWIQEFVQHGTWGWHVSVATWPWFINFKTPSSHGRKNVRQCLVPVVFMRFLFFDLTWERFFAFLLVWDSRHTVVGRNPANHPGMYKSL